MGQKVNPISLRLQQTNRNFDSCWFNDHNYTHLLNRDIKIQSYINLVLKQLKYPSARFFIQNLPNKIKINVFFLNPKNARKNASGGVQLKKFSKIKNLATITKKTRQIKPGGPKSRATETTPWFLAGAKAKTNQLQKKSSFLKYYKTDKNNKIKALKYFLLNSCNIDKKSYAKKLRLTQNNSEIQIFLRYLLLKNFCLNLKQKLVRRETQSFLLANLVNFMLLSNKNKLFLTTNFLITKINDYKQHLQQNVIENKTKFSSLTTNKKISSLHLNSSKYKMNFLPLLKNPGALNSELYPGFPLAFPAKQQELRKTNFLNSNRNLVGFNSNAINVKHPNYYTSMIQSNTLSFGLLPCQDLNTNYLSLSLINKEPLNRTHNRYSQVFNNFNNLCTLSTTKHDKHSNLTILPLPFSRYPAGSGKEAGQGENIYEKNRKNVLLIRNSSYKKHLELQLSNVFSSDVTISFFRFFNEKQSAIFLAEEIIYYLEKRISFFKIKNQILRDIHKNLFLKGLRITCSGRVGGRSKKAQRAKTQIIKYGQTSLHVFSSKIDFASKHANTPFGLLGIKVWICYN